MFLGDTGVRLGNIEPFWALERGIGGGGVQYRVQDPCIL